jgi:hypothetical protein
MSIQEQLEPVRPSYLDQYQQDGRTERERRRQRRLTFCRITMQHESERRFRDGRLGYPDVEAARARYEQLSRVIDAEVGGGATRHGRLPWVVRQIPRLVAVIDCVVLFTFCSVIFNVALSDPLQNPVLALAALLLAVLAGGVAYTWLSLTGDRIKTFRGELGEVLWRVVGATSWLMIAVSLVVVAALAVLMYSRVVNEVTVAGDAVQAGAATPLGLVFAVISAVANLSVIAVHALDGSPQADQHRHIGRLLRRHQQAVHRRRLALLRNGDERYDV